MAEKTVAVVGGGAAGLAAAVACANALSKEARQGNAADVRIVVYEADERVGRSILRTGNGRCNYTNSNIGPYGISFPRTGRRQDPEFDQTPPSYRNGDFVEDVLAQLEHVDGAYRGKRGGAAARGRNAVSLLFEDLGMFYREEGDGRCYPLSGKASTVLNLLRRACAKAGVETVCDTPIERIDPRWADGAGRGADGSEGSGTAAPSHFLLRAKGGKILRADVVIVATGGRTARAMLEGAAGLGYEEPKPVLGPLALAEKGDVRRLDNIRAKVSASVLRGGEQVAREDGEVLFRKYGISGIVVFNLSRFAEPGDTLSLRLVSWMGEADLAAFLMGNRKRFSSRFGKQATCEDLVYGILQEPLADVVLARAGVKGPAVAGKEEVERIARAASHFDFTVEGIGDEAVAQVRRGGFAVGGSGVRASDLCVPSAPRLHIVGEALDVDAPCGGYNLHWAWASGMLAGYRAAQEALALTR